MDPTPVPHAALVMVGDGTKARFFRNEGTPLHVNLVVERVLEHPDPPTREQGTSPPGRFIGGVSGQRSAVEQTDWHRLEEERFAHEIAAALYRLAHANAFSHLVVVAPPKVLGNLRAAFHQEVSKRLVAEIPKDLTGQSNSDIARLLSRQA
jgi:protein required for attachment to host cells